MRSTAYKKIEFQELLDKIQKLQGEIKEIEQTIE